MYIQVRDIHGAERFIEEDQLELAIAAGEVVAFRRSIGWISAPVVSTLRSASPSGKSYSGQERRRSMLSKKWKDAKNNSF